MTHYRRLFRVHLQNLAGSGESPLPSPLCGTDTLELLTSAFTNVRWSNSSLESNHEGSFLLTVVW